MSERILGLDFGSKTVGVAVSDPLFLTAQALETISRNSENKLRRTLARIGEIISEYEVSRIVLGYPINMDGTEGERCSKTREFSETLTHRFGLPVTLVNEQLSTVEADEILGDMEVKKKDRKKYIDKIAAAIILQEYLDNRLS